MENHASQAPTPAFELGDIYYTLFRHKWKIILCSLAGLGAALALYKLRPPPYTSQAKLFIRYVISESKSGGAPGTDDAVKIDLRGDGIIKSELEILTSLDLAKEVARKIGPERILSKTTGGDDLVAAAGVLNRGLLVEVTPAGSVISVKFAHPDSSIVQPVLQEFVDIYQKKHVEIHHATGLVGDSLTQETDQLRARLVQTEEELRNAMNKAGIISLEDSKKTFAEQIARLRQEIFDVQAELAERSSILQELNNKEGSISSTAEAEQPVPLPPSQVTAYQKVVNRLAQFQKREQDYLQGGFTEESVRVHDVRALISEAEEQKKKMETQYPALGRLSVAVTVAAKLASGTYNPTMEAAQINALQVKIKVLNSQLAEVRAEATKVDELASNILELRRRKELDEANYRYFSASLEQSRINDALGSGRVSNISEIQNPTPPAKDWTKRLKLIGGAAASGIIFGLAWAFAIELYFDRTVRRSTDVERTLRLPLFLSIPKLKAVRSLGARSKTGADPLRLPDSESGSSKSGSTHQLQKLPELSLIPSGGDEAFNPYYETLRDRLISYFDTLNVRHKPKLVAVTGLGKDTGVTTIAAGLARSFSETGEGNVLLVDMTQGQGSAQHFHKGATVVGLEQMLDTRGSAQVQDNLFVVSENSNSDRLAKGMPQRFNQLIPKLKASDFDYIIFDMPPVNQISVTPRLASFMDMMLLVIESEKTDREIALQASAMLAKSKSPVGVVLNKTKSYVPPALHQDRDLLLGT
jgi:polysaccharide biosynthesis transport protein